MFGKMKDMMELQKKAKEMEKALGSLQVEKQSKDGQVRLVLNGNNKVEELSIGEIWLSPDKKAELEQTLIRLISEAAGEVRQKASAQTMGMMKGMGMGL